MLTSDMFFEIFVFYANLYNGEKIKRKKLQIVIDSIIEQLCVYYIQSKPNGRLNVRASIINKISSVNEDEDKNILEALNALLRKYDEAFSKAYIDHDKDFTEFINNELKNLVLSITEHNLHTNDEYSILLRGFLR